MADFNDKRIRKLVEPDGLIATATAEDLALLIALCRGFQKRALQRISQIAELDDIKLDPIPSRPDPSAKPPKDDDGTRA